MKFQAAEVPTEADLQTGLVPRGGNTRAWKVYANSGQLSRVLEGQVRSLVIVARNNAGKLLARLEYGSEPTSNGEPSDFDTWIVKNGSGAVVVPFVVVEGELLICVIDQDRFTERHAVYNPSGKVWNVPRGNFSALREADAAAQHELMGEVGLFAEKPFRLEGENINVDNGWFSYEDELKDGESVMQGGVALFAVRVNRNEMERIGDTRSWRVANRILEGRPKGSAYEKIGGCIFLPWQQALKLRDGFTSIVTARLLSHLVTTGAATLTFP